MNNKGHENLIPANERSEDEVRELGKNGGIKSGEARRAKRKLKEELQALMELAQNGQTNQERLCFAIFEKALKGDVQAFNAIRDTMGEKPVAVVEQTNIEKQDSTLDFDLAKEAPELSKQVDEIFNKWFDENY